MAHLFSDEAEFTEPSALRKILSTYEKKGFLTIEHLRDFFLELGLEYSDDELQDKMDEADRDANGTIDVNEFFTLILDELRVLDTEQEVVDSFKVFDKDGSGFIDAEDIRHIMTHLGDQLSGEEVDQFIKKADLDGDGHINYEEFTKKMMEKIRAHEENLTEQYSATAT